MSERALDRSSARTAGASPAGFPELSGDPGDPGDHWDRAFRALGRRRLFRVALAILALLYGAAIYAPLIASDRPYLLEAIDRGAFDRARRSLLSVALGLKGLVEGGEEAYLAGRTAGSEQGFEGALEAELEALEERTATLRRFLPAAEDGRLATLEAQAADVVRAQRAGEPSAPASAAALVASARELRDALEWRAQGADDDADGDQARGRPALPSGVPLEPERSWPLLQSISGLEAAFMALWACVLSWPLWNRLVNRRLLGADPIRVRRWRRRKLGLVLSLALVAGAAWQLAFQGRTVFYTAPYKQALGSGEMTVTRVVFPPLALGFAETHLSERFRPPTWTAAAAISEEGYYQSPARASRPDPLSGVLPPPQPVDVRFAEPARNAPLRHPFGTDSLGRDLFVRSLYGARVSLSVGIVSTVLLVVIGTLLGALAGYFGGRVDLLISRLIEVVLCFPVFFLILVVVAFVGPSILNIMVVIGLLRWTGVARLARAEFLRLKELDFVVAARALGLPARRTVFRHVLPNALGPLLVAASFSVAAGILIESGLSFLGFGIQLPIPSWGALLNESRSPSHWWVQVFPGALIFVTVLCYNVIGDAVRDALDPRGRR